MRIYSLVTLRFFADEAFLSWIARFSSNLRAYKKGKEKIQINMERVYGAKIPFFAKQINYFSVIEQQDIF